MSCARVLAGVLLAAIFLLGGCGSATSEGLNDDSKPKKVERDNGLHPETVTLNDGRIVECVVYVFGEGSLWCGPVEGG